MHQFSHHHKFLGREEALNFASYFRGTLTQQLQIHFYFNPFYAHLLNKICSLSGNTQLSCKYLINLTVADVQKTMIFVFNNKNSTTCLPPQSKIFTNSIIYVNMEHLDKVREVCEFHFPYQR